MVNMVNIVNLAKVTLLKIYMHTHINIWWTLWTWWTMVNITQSWTWMSCLGLNLRFIVVVHSVLAASVLLLELYPHNPWSSGISIESVCQHDQTLSDGSCTWTIVYTCVEACCVVLTVDSICKNWTTDRLPYKEYLSRNTRTCGRYG